MLQDALFIANDWQTGLLPLYHLYKYRRNNTYRNSRCVFVIHNIGYQADTDATQLRTKIFEQRKSSLHAKLSTWQGQVPFEQVPSGQLSWTSTRGTSDSCRSLVPKSQSMSISGWRRWGAEIPVGNLFGDYAGCLNLQYFSLANIFFRHVSLHLFDLDIIFNTFL